MTEQVKTALRLIKLINLTKRNSFGDNALQELEYYSVTRKIFSMLAPFYDILTAPVAGIRETVVRFALAKPKSRVLDIATGTGAQAFAFAKHAHKVTGVDISESMLAVARAKNSLKAPHFEVADAVALPFPNDSFDVSSISFALHDMPPAIRERVLDEMVRVTMPGGTIIIADYALPGNSIIRSLICALIRAYEGPYYTDFIHSDLKELLMRHRVRVQGELPILLGAGKITRGTKIHKN